MSSSICLRRLPQLSSESSIHSSIGSRNLLSSTQTSSFSTSTARFASPLMKKKTGQVAAPKRGAKTLNVKKGRGGSGRDTGRKPAIGERKALRKRIVLSNTNALEVPTLQDLTKDNVLDKAVEGKVMGIPGEVVDALRAVEAFKTSQGWSLFRRPAALMRKETVQIAELVKQVEAGEAKAKQTIRKVLVGDKMSGKSTLVLQGLMIALLRNWVVINLPDAKDIVLGHTEYAPLPGSTPTQYYQETYTATLLSQIAKANSEILSKIQVTSKPALPIPTPPKLNLLKLAELGAANPEASWPVFVALWKELTLPGRPPIMMAIDNLAHVMRNSEYLSADAKPVHAHDLTIVRHFVDHLSGTKTLPNGGIILAAETKSNSPACPALDYSIQLAEARQLGREVLPEWNPYKVVDMRVMECLRNMEVLRSNGLSKEEARAIMEYYAASGMLRAKVDAPFVSERWTLAGQGNIGELERASVRARI
ncbi:hypothetical protein GQ43DRAFT_485120 [Delitschia confertaspora ATCC 74209]|uniref:Small ribosomal subunit protein mS29 n=1 Tax=Delitschia confertaspora ATCC 74209 TaxID=1513339 RepID=A0A9P4MML4_9PLEO|nr:hypothetical protein GQ43DRAFT_485120 [Delitschia confertaspora ATCC 74209]